MQFNRQPGTAQVLPQARSIPQGLRKGRYALVTGIHARMPIPPSAIHQCSVIATHFMRATTPMY